MLDALAPSRRRFVLLVLGVVVTAVVVGAGVTVVRLAGGVDPVAQDRPGPVVLVSGYGGSVRALGPLERALVSAGRDVVVLEVVGDGTGDIAAQAESLGSAAQEAVERFDAVSVDVVGYSAGGVVARSWVRDHGGDALARRVVSIGSPQHGTTVAEQAAGVVGSCPVACIQLSPDSDFLRALNAGDETPEGPVFISIWSTSDDVVLPADSARLEGALNLTVQGTCPRARTRHSGLPGDAFVLASLATVLSAGPARPPGEGFCG
ncbi:lipase [soil metagenome]